MDKLEFCPDCGHEITEVDLFCAECGFDIKSFTSEEEEKPVEDFSSAYEMESAQPVKPVAIKTKAKTASKKKYIWLLVILAIGAVMTGLYFGANWYYGKDKQVAALQEEVASGNVTKMKHAMIDINDKRLSADSVDALKRLYLKDRNAIKNIEQQIKNPAIKNSFLVVPAGKYLGLFDRYKVQVSPKDFLIDTNIDNPEFYINGRSMAVANVGDYYKINILTPGVYDLKIKGSDDSKDEQVSLAPVRDATKISVNVKKEDIFDEQTTDDDDSNDESNEQDNTDTTAEPTPNKSQESSLEALAGEYSGDPHLTLNSNKTYTLGDKSGRYTWNRTGNNVEITYYENGGESVTESYDFDGKRLYSDKYDQSWYKI